MVAIIVVAVVVSVTILIASMLFLKKLRLKFTINAPPAISGNQPEDIKMQAAALSVEPILAIKAFEVVVNDQQQPEESETEVEYNDDKEEQGHQQIHEALRSSSGNFRLLFGNFFELITTFKPTI